MFIETIRTPGLAHLSYVLGDAGDAAVVDPRRDWGVYVDTARRHGARIRDVFETHRNEDFVSGAAGLAEATDAEVHHGPNPARPVRYARTVHEGDAFSYGDLALRVLETPGHTDDSISLVAADRGFGSDPVAVFTGDALFVGDVGRTDFYPERHAEVAGLLYDSLRKLLALGDGVIVHPAHGAGSVCGAGMADREFSTLGYERAHNPMLQIDDRAAFVRQKLGERHATPPYFRHMEAVNLVGMPWPERSASPAPLGPGTFEKCVREGSAIVDVRSIEAFAGAHVPGALALPVDMVASFAGWLLRPEQRLVLVAEDAGAAARAALHLARIGIDGTLGFLPGTGSWTKSGRGFDRIAMVDTAVVRERRAAGAGWSLLDVRRPDEFERGHVEGAVPLYLGELPQRLAELPRDRAWTVMCGSGVRATIGASVLRRAGFERVDVYLGSMAAWQASRSA